MTPTPLEALPSSHLKVWTYKAGLLSKVAHDLCIEAGDLRG